MAAKKSVKVEAKTKKTVGSLEKKDFKSSEKGLGIHGRQKPITEKEFDPWSVLMYPHMAEKSMSLVDLQNKIVFVVRKESSKPDIKTAFEKLFDVKVVGVQTERTIIGQKKAFIKLDPKYSAADIATRLGIL